MGVRIQWGVIYRGPSSVSGSEGLAVMAYVNVTIPLAPG